MAAIMELTGVKCPFKPVAEYPPALPYVGQDACYHRLQDFTDSIRREDDAHFFAVFGDWAIGKSRLAHELIAQFCGHDRGWILSDGQPAARLLQPPAEGGTILPLFVSFVDALHFEHFGLDVGTAMGKLTCAAVAYLADEHKARSSHRAVLGNLREALTALDPNFDFDRLKSVANDRSRSFTERSDQLVSLFARMTGGKVTRLLVLVDEVESATENNPFADEIEREVNAHPVPLKAVGDLYSGVKEAADTRAYPRLNFLFFNTQVSKRMAVRDALERRMVTADLDKASASDLDRLIEALRASGYPLRGTLEDLARRAFFAADRNFGWFSFIMNKAHFILLDHPEFAIAQVFSEVCKRTGRIFQPRVFEDRDIEPHLKAVMRHIIYNQVPVRLSALEAGRELEQPLLAYQDPFQTRFIGRVVLVRVTADQLTNGLLTTGKYKSDQKPTLIGEGSAKFDPAEVLASLRTFAWLEGEQPGDQPGRLWIYADSADFEGQISFAYSGFGSNLSAETVRTMHRLLLEHHRVQDDGDLVAPTMALLRRFNDLWGQAAASNWLPEKVWEQINSAIDQSPQLNDQRLLQGMANTLFEHPQPITSPTPYPDVRAPVLALKLESHETYNVTPRNQLVLLKARETAQGIMDDLHAIRQGSPVIVVFVRASDRDAWLRHVRETHQKHLTISAIPHVVETQTREWDFYVRYALRDQNGGFKADDVEPRGKELRREFQDVLRNEFKEWLKGAEEAGYVLRPFYPARSANTPAFRDFARAYTALLLAGDAAAVNRQQGGAALLKALEDYERERHDDTLQLIEGEGAQRRALIPPIVPRILDLLHTQPRKLSELENDLFYARSQRAVTFPTTGSGVLDQLMTILQEMGIVETDSQSRYVSRSVSAINHKFELALQRLGSFDAPKSGYAQQVSALSASLRTLAQQLAVNEDQLLLLKTQELAPTRDQLRELPLDRLADLPPDQPAFIEVARSIGTIATALDKVLGKAGQPTQVPALDPRTLHERISEMAADGGYQQFSIEYRVEFLKKLEAYLADSERELKDVLEERRASLKQQYSASQNGSPFSTQPMLALLQAIQDDLQETLPGNVLPLQLRQQSGDVPLKVVKGAGRLADVLLRVDWYRRQLDVSNPQGWWVQYTTAYQTWQGVLASYQEVEGSWTQLERYFERTPRELVIKFTGAELAQDVQELRDLVQNFAAGLDQQPNVTLADLGSEIAGTRDRCASALELIQAARVEAEGDIERRLADTEDTAVRHLAERLHQEQKLPNRQRVQNARTYHDAGAALENYRANLREVGAALCDGRPELLDTYLRIYRDKSDGMDSDQLVTKYGEAVLRELSERRLIALKMVVEI